MLSKEKTTVFQQIISLGDRSSGSVRFRSLDVANLDDVKAFVESESGKLFGTIPWETYLAKVFRMRPAISGRPVQRVRPGRLIIVSRPQSANQW